jgi:hypothetical protein
MNDTFFKDDGPVFVLIDGEASGSAQSAVTGQHMELAAVFNALVFVVEHRFYGVSVPDNSLDADHLQLLSSQQALADLAFFVETMNAQHNLTAANVWISFGGSYPGSLSAWFRIKVSGAARARARSRDRSLFRAPRAVPAPRVRRHLVLGARRGAAQL